MVLNRFQITNYRLIFRGFFVFLGMRKSYLYRNAFNITGLALTVGGMAVPFIAGMPDVRISLFWLVAMIVASGAAGWVLAWFSFMRKRKGGIESIYQPGMKVRSRRNNEICVIVKKHPFRRNHFICEHADGKRFTYSKRELVVFV